jgi:hypothetical protein
MSVSSNLAAFSKQLQVNFGKEIYLQKYVNNTDPYVRQI